MIHGRLQDADSERFILRGPVWAKALDWLRDEAPDAKIGRHPLLGEDVVAIVMEYETMARRDARFESHREFVDVQYTLDGDEEIDWSPLDGLVPDGPFEQDLQFWLPPASGWSTLCQPVGRFAVFFPGDAHRPKIRRSVTLIRKVVIKIRARLLELDSH
jgi:YhcH/YjgK/YiaL family protein